MNVPVFIFAQRPQWKDELDTDTLAAVAALLRDYEACLSRIRACRAPVTAKHRESDLNRILYARGQENEVQTGCMRCFRFFRRSASAPCVRQFQLLGDLVCDIDDENAAHERKVLHRETDSAAFNFMMHAYTEKSFSGHDCKAVAEACRTQLDRIVEPVLAVQYVTALGKRKLLFELLPDAMEEALLEVYHEK